MNHSYARIECYEVHHLWGDIPFCQTSPWVLGLYVVLVPHTTTHPTHHTGTFKQLLGNLGQWNFRTMQCNAIQCKKCKKMQCNAMQKMQCNTIQYNSQPFKQLPGNLELWNFRTMQCNAIQCNIMPKNAMQYNAKNAMQYNTSLNLLSNFQAT